MPIPPIRLITTLLCAVGFYASVFMERKYLMGARGELREPSVVQNPRARLVGGVPNALIGLVYYPAMALASWLPPGLVHLLALGAAALAAVMTLYLAYSLLFVTKRSCPYCFTAHAVNVALLAAAAWQAFHA